MILTPPDNGARYRPYRAYKQSDLEWLPQVPNHWSVKKLKRIAMLRAGSTITSDDIQDEGPYPVFGGNGVRGFSSRFTHEGDFPLVGRQGALCGCVNFASGRFWASEHAIVVSALAGIQPQWLAYMLRALALNEHAQSAAQPGLTIETIADLSMPVPQLAEQVAITSFLDRETARIDSAIEKNQHLLKLLAERRARVMESAVVGDTRVSRDQWPAAIPSDWKRLRFVLDGFPKNGLSPAIGSGGDRLTFSTAAVSNGEIKLEGNLKYTKLSDEAAKPVLVERGDILMLRGSGSLRLVGAAGVLESEPPLGCIYPDILIRIRPSSKITPWYLVTCLNSSLVRAQIESGASTASGIWKISSETVRELRIPVPSIGEQRRIQDRVAKETIALANAIEVIQRSVKALSELRTSVIAVAATGAIDVRLAEA